MFRQIDGCEPGDMPGFGPSMLLAYQSLAHPKTQAALKHCIIIADGDPSPPSNALLGKFRAARISVSTIGIAPHGGGDIADAGADAGAGHDQRVANLEG